MSRSSSFLASFVSILIVFGSACTLTQHIGLEPKLDSLPAVEKQPVTLGVYYSEEFRKYVHQQAFGSDWHVVNLGEASAKLFDRLVPSACEKTVSIPRLPAGERFEGVAAILEPRIEAFQVHYLWQKAAEDFPRVTYRIILYTPDGSPVLSQVIQGRGKDGTINGDMEDAGRKFLEGFSAWYEGYLRSDPGRGAQAEPPDMHLVTATAEPFTDKVEMRPGTKEAKMYPFRAAGVIAAKVAVRNDSERDVVARGSDFHVILPDGSRIVPACATVVIERLEVLRHGADTAAAWLLPFGTTATVISQTGDRSSSLADLKEKQFGDKTLAPGETAEGLIYFAPAEGTPAFASARLEFWCMDPDSLSSRRVEFAVDDFAYAPVKK